MLNVGEYGEKIYVDLSEDVSPNTNQIILKDPDGVETTKTATAGTVNVTTAIGLLIATEYIEYTWVDGDLSKAGNWCARVVSTGGGIRRKTDWLPFEVKK